MDLATRQLQQHLSALGYHPDVIVLTELTGSTNDDAKSLAAQGIERALVASRQQTKGRGQHERQWLSPLGNIYLSILLPCTTALDGRLALEVGLNIINLPCFQGQPLQIKWPNDLYSPLGKWGGILIEALSTTQVVIGIGINLYTPLHQDSQPITSLGDLGCTLRDAIGLLAQLYHAVIQAQQWFEHGSYRLAQRFNHHAVFLQQRVCFEHQQSTAQGIFQGVDAQGAAVILTDPTHADSHVAALVQTFYQGQLRCESAAPQRAQSSQSTCTTSTAHANAMKNLDTTQPCNATRSIK